MDEEDMVSYYLKKSEDWIFVPKFRNVKIEDDEILDLDSMNLDSNEDTWLYSSSDEKSVLKDSSDSMEHEELEKEFGRSNEIESKKEKFDITGSPLSPLLGPDDFQHPSFLNSIDEMSDTALENLLRTPHSVSSKNTLFRRALSNSSHSYSELNCSVTIPACDPTHRSKSSADETDALFKRPTTVSSAGTNSSSVAKSYVLHSVENKLFNLADVNTTAELIKNRDLKNVEIARKTAANKIGDLEDGGDEEDAAAAVMEALCRRFDDHMKCGGGVGDGPVNDENTLTSCRPQRSSTTASTFAAQWHSTPQHHESGATKPPARRSFPQQPTPILLNRHLKHRNQDAAAAAEILYNGGGGAAADAEECLGGRESLTPTEQQQQQRNEMNVSYVKYDDDESGVQLPRINAQNGLRSVFSKSDDVLNSSYSEPNSSYGLPAEDDAASSTSESSLSSMSHKRTLSIQEVQKMADEQEKSLKKQVYSSYYAGSSKSSEVSSSNESVSTYGVLSNSNEGSIDMKPPRTVQRIQAPKSRLSYTKNPPPSCNTRTNSRIGTYERTANKTISQPSQLASNIGAKTVSAAPNETKLNTAYRSRVLVSNGQYSNVSQSPNRKRQTLPSRPTTGPPKLVIPVDSANEIVSVKEITNTNKNTSNAGPGSHIPRPASRIPMFRSSSSCNRNSKS